MVATGGGIVTQYQNWGHMQHGVVVWLRGAPHLLAARIMADGVTKRPLVADAQVGGASLEGGLLVDPRMI